MFHTFDHTATLVYIQVGAKIEKSTWPVYSGRTVITGRNGVGDMLD